MAHFGILVVEDDRAFARMCVKLLAGEGYLVRSAASGTEALAVLAGPEQYHAVLTDIRMPEMDGLRLLATLRERHPTVQVVLMTGYGSIKDAVEAMKSGAADYILKPFDNQELLVTIGRLARLVGLQDEVVRLRSQIRGQHGFDAILGRSQAMRSVCDRVRAACFTRSTVLILGESGTGKDLVARTIHYGSAAADGPFVPVNCAALPQDIIESELFGHAKGAFTGAVGDHPGLFRAAHGGTIFLDEFTEMGTATQAKLLRVIEDGRVRSLGATDEEAVDVRVIAATNRAVDEALASERLRADLYYRLSVITISVPPLRERPEDIPLLAAHFVAEFNRRFGRNVRGLDADALAEMSSRPWPGNVREVRNVIESAFAMSSGDVITKIDLRANREAPGPSVAWGAGALPRLPQALADLEQRMVAEALARCGGNKTRAAEMLGISRRRIYRKMEP